jgi:hypothetical protein
MAVHMEVSTVYMPCAYLSMLCSVATHGMWLGADSPSQVMRE